MPHYRTLPRPFTPGTAHPLPDGRWVFTIITATGERVLILDFPMLDAPGARRALNLFCTVVGNTPGLVVSRVPRYL